MTRDKNTSLFDVFWESEGTFWDGTIVWMFFWYINWRLERTFDQKGCPKKCWVKDCMAGCGNRTKPWDRDLMKSYPSWNKRPKQIGQTPKCISSIPTTSIFRCYCMLVSGRVNHRAIRILRFSHLGAENVSIYQGDLPGTPKDMGSPKMVSGTHTIPIPFPYL